MRHSETIAVRGPSTPHGDYVGEHTIAMTTTCNVLAEALPSGLIRIGISKLTRKLMRALTTQDQRNAEEQFSPFNVHMPTAKAIIKTSRQALVGGK